MVQQVEHPSLPFLLGSHSEISNPAPDISPAFLLEVLISSAAHPQFLMCGLRAVQWMLQEWRVIRNFYISILGRDLMHI